MEAEAEEAPGRQAAVGLRVTFDDPCSLAMAFAACLVLLSPPSPPLVLSGVVQEVVLGSLCVGNEPLQRNT